jgi:hypothetical protein
MTRRHIRSGRMVSTGTQRAIHMRVYRLGSAGRPKSERYPLQAMLEEFLAKQLKASRLMALLIAKELEKQGAKGVMDRLEDLQAEIERRMAAGEDWDFEEFVLDDGSSEERAYSLDLTPAQIDSLGVNVEVGLAAAVEKMTAMLFESTLKAVDDQTEESLSRRTAEIEAFQQRLADRWRKPLRLLAVQIGLAAQFGDDFNDYLREKATIENGATVDSLTRLQARAVQIAGEVEALLKNGYADGAMSRWRTLHEVVVVAFFIDQFGNEVAEAYLDHLAIDSLRHARMYREAAPKLGYAPMLEREWTELQTEAARLMAKHGDAFGKDYGWAARALGKDRPTFTDIELAVEFDKYRPYYKMASNNIHAGPRGVFSRLGRLSGEDILLSGPSNAGLEEPGRLTAFSLSQISAPLLMIEPNMDANVWARVIQHLAGEIEHAFLEAKEQLEKDERRLSGVLIPKPRRLRSRREPKQRRV